MFAFNLIKKFLIMKTSKLNLFRATTVLVVFFTTFTSVYASIGAKENTNVTAVNCNEENPDREVKTAKLHFKKGKVYEIIHFTFNKNNEKILYENYFPKAMPVFEKYGRKFFAWFNVVEGATSENFKSAKNVVIVEWPNYKAYEKMQNDKEYKEIAHYRNGGFSFFQHGWFKINEDKVVEVREDKVYQFVGATLQHTEEAKTSLDKYFKISDPIKRRIYGPSFLDIVADFTPIGSIATSGYDAEIQLISEWPNEKSADKLFSDKDFQTKAIPLMMKAIRHTDYSYTKYKF